MRVAYIDDGTVTGDAATPSWDSVNKILTVKIQSGVTTAETIIAAVNALAGFSTDYEALGYGSGTVALTITPNFTQGGSNSAKSDVTVNPDGSNNAIEYEAKAKGSQYDGMGIVYVDDGSVTGNNATPYWNATAMLLIVKIDSGVTEAATIISQVNGL